MREGRSTQSLAKAQPQNQVDRVRCLGMPVAPYLPPTFICEQGAPVNPASP